MQKHNFSAERGSLSPVSTNSNELQTYDDEDSLSRDKSTKFINRVNNVDLPLLNLHAASQRLSPRNAGILPYSSAKKTGARRFAPR